MNKTVNQAKEKFNWTGKYQVRFDLWNSNLMSMPVLDCPDYGQPFELKTNASLQGLSGVLSQRDENGESHVITYASRFLHSNEQSMQNYNSAKLELSALKWAVPKTLKNYYLGSKFTIYTDNNPLGLRRVS